MPLFAVSAIVPSLMLIWFFRSRDVNPEPARVIWATFFLGVLTVIPVLLVDWPIGVLLGKPSDPFAHGFGEAFLVAGIPEEFFKFLVVVLFCARHREFDEPMDGIVYGAIASLGFATLENILYVSENGLGTAVLRAVSAVPGHAFMGAIMGYYVGQARFNPAKRGSFLIRGYLFAVLLHGLYDSGLLTVNAMSAPTHSIPDECSAAAGLLLLLTLSVLVFEGVWALRLVRRLRAEQFQIAAQQRPVYPPIPMGPWNGFPPVVHAPSSPTPMWQPTDAAFQSSATPNAFDQLQPVWPGPGPMPLHPPPPPRRGAALAWFMVITGGILGTIGGLVTLGIAVALATSDRIVAAETSSIVCGGVVIGVLPLAIGVFLFARGVKKFTPPRVPGNIVPMPFVAP